jgi:PAS domain S-box-containing protein
MILKQVASDGGELLEALLASMVDGIYAVDAAGRVLFANRAALSILGYAEDGGLVGSQSHATIHYRRHDGSPFPEAECPLLQPRSSGKPVRVEQDWFIRRDGTFVPVAYSSAPVMVDGDRGAVVVFRDISERHRAAAEHERAEAIHASRERIVRAALDERRRLGRDLHDGAQQRLINVIVALQLAAQRTTDDASREPITAALDETQRAIEDLRDLGSGLHPSVLAHRGLRAAIASLTARTPVPVTLDVPVDRFPAVVEGTAYFVAAEAMANVAKHAQATEARVSITVELGGLRVEIADDGRGGAAPNLAGGSGLAGLEDRVAAVGGTLSIQSPAGAGTRVIARLPLAAAVRSPAAG